MAENAVGVVLSGSGFDGSEGLEEVERMQGIAIVQEPKSCLTKDMSQAALGSCSPDYIISDIDIPATINELLA